MTKNSQTVEPNNVLISMCKGRSVAAQQKL